MLCQIIYALGLSCGLVQVVGQVLCLSKYRYIFSINLSLSMNHPLFPSEDGRLSEKDNVMGHITHTIQQVHIKAVPFSHQVTLEKRQ